jgi:hypothetical protein
MTKINRYRDLFKQLCAIEKELSDMSHKNFSLDGHLVGSFAEEIAAIAYDLELSETSNEKHIDAKTRDGKNVQIKVRRKVKHVEFTDNFLNEQNDLIVLIFHIDRGIDDLNLQEVYNGNLGKIKELIQSKTTKSKCLSLTELAKHNEHLLPKKERGIIKEWPGEKLFFTNR